jgi:hypothetical protein
MNHATMIFIALLLATAGISPVFAQPGTEMSPEDMQEKWAEYMMLAQPSEAHQNLDETVGTWQVTVKIWMAGPGSEPIVSTGTAQREWVLDGRYVREVLRTEMMGQPFEGLGYTGYDNYKNLYVSTWMDNMSTSLSTSKGQRDPATGVFTFYGEMDEPMLSVHGRMVKMVMRPHGSEAHVFEMYDLHAGDDYKVMEITYRQGES